MTLSFLAGAGYGVSGKRDFIAAVSGGDSFVILRALRVVIPFCRRRYGGGISGEVAG